MGTAYVKNYSGVWVPGAGGGTPITAAALNNLETQYDDAMSQLTDFKNILTTRGDIPFRGASDWTRLPKGSLNQVLTQGVNDPFWAAVATGIWGDGSDGSVTITTNTSLSRDMYYSALTVNNGIKLTSNGYRIFCNGTLTNNGTIDRSGGAGGNGTSTTYGAGGVGTTTGSLGGSPAGSDGYAQASGDAVAGGGGGGGGVIFIAASILINNGIISANGGAGGSAYYPSTSGNHANVGGTSVTNSLGGAGGSSTPDYGGGAGGNSSPPAASETGFRSLPFAAILRLVSNPTTQISGGASGSGGGGYAITTKAAGSGGGGGGVIVLVYASITVGTIQANGGAYGSGLGGGPNGTAGSNGTIIQIAT